MEGGDHYQQILDHHHDECRLEDKNKTENVKPETKRYRFTICCLGRPNFINPFIGLDKHQVLDWTQQRHVAHGLDQHAINTSLAAINKRNMGSGCPQKP